MTSEHADKFIEIGLAQSQSRAKGIQASNSLTLNSHDSSVVLWKGVLALIFGVVFILIGISSFSSNSPLKWIGGIVVGASFIIYGAFSLMNANLNAQEKKSIKGSRGNKSKLKNINSLTSECTKCSGTGFVQKQKKSAIGVMKTSTPCNTCGGIGMI